MTVDAIGSFDDFSEWLSSEKVGHVQRELEERIIKFLFSQDADSVGFFQMAAQLAWVGTHPENRPKLLQEIVEIKISFDGSAQQCKGWFLEKLSVGGHFLLDHKWEIIGGVALIASGVAIAAATGYTLSFCIGGVVVAGTGSILDSLEKQPVPKIPNTHSPTSKEEIALVQQGRPLLIPQLNLPSSPTEILVTPEGIWAASRFYSNELLKQSTFCDILAQVFPSLSQAPSLTGDLTLPSQEIPVFGNIPNQPIATIEESARPEIKFPSSESPTNYPYFPSTQASPSFEIPPPISVKYTLIGTQDSYGYIGWMNGIDNTFEESRNSAAYIQQLAGGHAISGIYNHSHGAITGILEAAILNHHGYSPHTARLLKEEWTAFHEAHADRPNAKILWICHSQGALHTRNALRNLPQEVRDRIIVVAIAPAAVVPDELCFKAYNYASERDIVYKFEPSPPLTFDTKTVNGRIALDIEGEYPDYRNELIILRAHDGATAWYDIDHSFQNPTFLAPLKYVFEDYKIHRGEYLPKEKGRKRE